MKYIEVPHEVAADIANSSHLVSHLSKSKIVSSLPSQALRIATHGEGGALERTASFFYLLPLNFHSVTSPLAHIIKPRPRSDSFRGGRGGDEQDIPGEFW